jgi:hypothetical protein
MEKPRNELMMMPNYFKKIGLMIILCAILFALIVPYFFRDTSLFQENKRSFRIFSMDVLLLGGFLYCLAKDKIEDERTMLFRTQAMATAFIFGVVFTITGPFFEILFGGSDLLVDAQQVIATMLLIYLGTFIGKKKSF